MISHLEFMVLMFTTACIFYLLCEKIETQCYRTDKLYETFINELTYNR